MNKNRITGLILCMISILYIYMTSALPKSIYGSSVGANVFPYISSIGLFICSVVLFFRKESEKDKAPFLDKAGWKRVLMAFASLIAFSILFDIIGFIIASVLFLFVMITLFDLEKAVSKKTTLIVSIVTTGILYVLFKHILNARLPVGELFELFVR